jgi:hypothetical protein
VLAAVLLSHSQQRHVLVIADDESAAVVTAICGWAQIYNIFAACTSPGPPVVTSVNHPCPCGGCAQGQKCCPDGSCVTGKCITTCPIVLDTFDEGFHLTSLNDGVQFRVLPGGPLQQMSWTDANWRNGWLALDRNGDGTIDDFTELFGNYTARPPSNNPNGFLALAVFDDPANGGNGQRGHRSRGFRVHEAPGVDRCESQRIQRA